MAIALFLLPKNREKVVTMPYVYYDELPEGAEEADVITREDYDAIVSERDSVISQRDEALSQVEEAHKEVRDTKAKYADAILSANRKSHQPKQQKTVKSTLPTSINQLFATKE